MEELISISGRTIVMFVAVLLFFRLTGKKDVGEVSVLDIIITIMVAELAVILIEDTKMPLIRGLTPIALLILLSRVFSYLQVKNQRFRDVVDGKPVLLIRDGVFIEENLLKQNYNIDDIMMQLRDKDIADIQEVDWALLESSGSLSVFKKNDHSPLSLPLIMDGILQHRHLDILDIPEEEVHQALREEGIHDIRHVFYCSRFQGNFFIQKKNRETTD
ncbi:DUF421 domain-containing protein [Shouchella clausii]|uniref:DUF421 domain-containing protein n=1 Tax=Shouchella clausii TaxID=79880 RepID=UPI00270E540A|nr:DUF421 domain-containing protein [Shouchella clausii]MDO7266977.1 DUF421 domain-containing protein [Shouchella clausii]MDO7286108.1 DUF421 domain-containing protein [Shouchella clausii]